MALESKYCIKNFVFWYNATLNAKDADSMGLFTYIQRKVMYRPRAQDRNPTLPPLALIKLPYDDKGDKTNNFYKKAKAGEKTYVIFSGSEFDPSLQHYRGCVEELLRTKPDCGIMMVGYPGYAGSDGQPTEQSIYDASNIAIQHVLKDVVPDDISLVGYSLGCSAALEVAKNNPEIQNISLISPFENAIIAATKTIDRMLPKSLSKGCKWIANNWFEDRFDNVSKLKDLTAQQKVTIFYGGRTDHLADDARTLASTTETKCSISQRGIRGADHKSMLCYATKEIIPLQIRSLSPIRSSLTSQQLPQSTSIIPNTTGSAEAICIK